MLIISKFYNDKYVMLLIFSYYRLLSIHFPFDGCTGNFPADCISFWKLVRSVQPLLHEGSFHSKSCCKGQVKCDDAGPWLLRDNSWDVSTFPKYNPVRALFMPFIIWLILLCFSRQCFVVTLTTKYTVFNNMVAELWDVVKDYFDLLTCEDSNNEPFTCKKLKSQNVHKLM